MVSKLLTYSAKFKGTYRCRKLSGVREHSASFESETQNQEIERKIVRERKANSVLN